MRVTFDLVVEQHTDEGKPTYMADNVRNWEQISRQRGNFVPKNQSGGKVRGRPGRTSHPKRNTPRTKEEKIRRILQNKRGKGIFKTTRYNLIWNYDCKANMACQSSFFTTFRRTSSP